MFATPKSRSQSRPSKPPSAPRLAFSLLLFLGLTVASLHAEDTPNPVFLKRFEKTFLAAKARLASDTNNPAALWQLARAAFDWADVQSRSADRAAIARQGIAAARQLLAQDPKSVEAHYYLAMDLGELAETESLGALKLVREMETNFLFVLKADAAFDHAGPHRNLGLLYRDAPGWPTSIGNRDKARQHLKQAVVVSPDFPENPLNVIEAEIKWNEPAKAQRDLKSLDDLWPKAQKKFAGEEWEPSWADWTKRRDDARKKAATATTVSTSPHNK